MRLLVLCLWLWGLALPSWAQTPTPADLPTQTEALFGQTYDEVISDAAIFDWYFVTLNANDRIRITMSARAGLAPLIGILDEGRNLVARSDEGNGEAAPDATITLDYRAPAEGNYAVIATRAGNEDGTTTGAYTLRIDLEAIAPTPNADLLEVEWRCGETLVTHALQFSFSDEPLVGNPAGLLEAYNLTVIGLEGFVPSLQAYGDVAEKRLDCSANGDAFIGMSLSLLDGTQFTIPADEAVASMNLRNTSDRPLGGVRMSAGSEGGAAGAFVAILSGLKLDSLGDSDLIELRLAAFAQTSPLAVYVLRTADSRLDPMLEVVDAAGTVLATCDDAGKRECAAIPAPQGFRLTYPDGTALSADRLAAGATLQPNSTEAQRLLIRASEGRTLGAYALVVFGELPPR